MEMYLEEDFLITVDEEHETIRATFDAKKVSGKRLWQWLGGGFHRILNLSLEGLASIAKDIEEKIEKETGDDWGLQSITITLSKDPTTTITIGKDS
jgi:hypothetical protein